MASQENVDEGSAPPTFTVESNERQSHTFILLHGLGSNGRKFGQEMIDTVVCLNGRKLTEMFCNARFVFPTAKRRRSNAFGRSKLTQWFDVASLEDISYRQDTQLQGLAESSEVVIKVLHDDQGCAMALSCLLAIDFPVKGFIGMSGWLPFWADTEQAMGGDVGVGYGDSDGDGDMFFGSNDEDNPLSASSESGEAVHDHGVSVIKLFGDLLCLDDLAKPTGETSSISTPTFLGHGSRDEKVSHSFGMSASATLRSIGYGVSRHSYSKHGHWYKSPDEIDGMVDFIESKVGWKIAGT
ncbi:phospholipase/carboxylesterase [Xylariaceae sp. FL0016]|nr:phospholipase/carboxylesterase [Xylariaceae sp. FL0016]